MPNNAATSLSCKEVLGAIIFIAQEPPKRSTQPTRGEQPKS